MEKKKTKFCEFFLDSLPFMSSTLLVTFDFVPVVTTSRNSKHRTGALFSNRNDCKLGEMVLGAHNSTTIIDFFLF